MTATARLRTYALGVIILAAGRSRRMGRPKLLLPWHKTSVLGHLIQLWLGLGAGQVAVVCAADDRDVRAELDRLRIPVEDRIENPEPERGMFSSIQCAARWAGWKSALTHWAVVLGDQPHLQARTLQAVCAFSAAQPRLVCQPAHNGHRRHPVLLPESAFRDLAKSTARDFKSFLSDLQVAACRLDDQGLDLDIDRPEDYRKALELNLTRFQKPDAE
jgi:molybdenum cofactor cytidylyltransferase